MEYINLTPHAIHLNDGRVFEPSGLVARIETRYSDIIGDTCTQICGDPDGLPEPKPGVRYIVSALVLNALSDRRGDLVAPATGHPNCVRNDKGHIVSVPCFIRRMASAPNH